MAPSLRRTFLLLFIFLVLAAIYVFFFRPDWLAVPPFQKVPKASALNSSKDPSTPNPDRPYFDRCGNEYDFLGELIAKGNICAVQPESPASSIEVPAQLQNYQGK